MSDRPLRERLATRQRVPGDPSWRRGLDPARLRAVRDECEAKERERRRRALAEASARKETEAG